MRSVGPVTAVRDDLHSSAALLRLPLGLARGRGLRERRHAGPRLVGMSALFKSRRHLIDVVSVERAITHKLFDQSGDKR